MNKGPAILTFSRFNRADGRSLVTAVALESSTFWIHDARSERRQEETGQRK